MTITWPITLPVSPLLEGFVETVPETIIRSQMDTGPAKTRRRTTAGIRKFTMAFLLSKTETAMFDGFYLNDLNGGASAFDFTHPRTGEALSLRLVKPPVYRPKNSDSFHVTLEAEALP